MICGSAAAAVVRARGRAEAVGLGQEIPLDGDDNSPHYAHDRGANVRVVSDPNAVDLGNAYGALVFHLPVGCEAAGPLCAAASATQDRIALDRNAKAAVDGRRTGSRPHHRACTCCRNGQRSTAISATCSPCTPEAQMADKRASTPAEGCVSTIACVDQDPAPMPHLRGLGDDLGRSGWSGQCLRQSGSKRVRCRQRRLLSDDEQLRLTAPNRPSPVAATATFRGRSRPKRHFSLSNSPFSEERRRVLRHFSRIFTASARSATRGSVLLEERPATKRSSRGSAENSRSTSSPPSHWKSPIVTPSLPRASTRHIAPESCQRCRTATGSSDVTPAGAPRPRWTDRARSARPAESRRARRSTPTRRAGTATTTRRPARSRSACAGLCTVAATS